VVWRSLDEFVAWLVLSYELDEIPECWREHHGFAMRLAALHADHLAVVMNSKPRELVLWNDEIRHIKTRA
jgi:hypothetical protein